ncbi:MAG: AAA family ATPase, partial [Dehalococcoidia bacterium]
MTAFTPAGRAPLVGRVRELETLLRWLEAAAAGTGGLVLLAGEPGIGKTRLLTELSERARAAGWQVLVGHAYESEGLPAYLPIVEALRGHVRACPPDLLAAQLGDAAPYVARILPELEHRLPALPAARALSPEYERYRLFESVADFLQ